MPVRRRQQETGAAERYREMGIAAALSRPWDYPTACGELAALLRFGYADLPKAAQALVARDVLFAFRLLPDVQTGYAVTAANGLLQAVEVALPKQKKAQAASEFKHSVVAHKRRARVQQEPVNSVKMVKDHDLIISNYKVHLSCSLLKIWEDELTDEYLLILVNSHRDVLSPTPLTGSLHIPHDVLVHTFSFLDMRSLVAAGLVCWSWNSAANDNNLWKMNYSVFFGVCHWNGTSIPISGLQNILDVVHNSMDSMSIEFTFYWKELFHKKYAECATWRFASNRALCGSCRSVIWLSNLTCASPHH